MNTINSLASANPGFAMQNKKEINVKLLLEGVPVIGTETDSDFLKRAYHRLDELSQDELGVLLRLNNDKVKADFLKKRLKLGIQPNFIKDEGLDCEHKAGIKAIPYSSWGSLPNGGLKLIMTEAAAIYNSAGCGTVWVGISDQTKRPTALETQIACCYPGMSRERFESTVLFNVAQTWTNSLSFVSSLSYSWYSLNGHLVMSIGIKKTNNEDIVLINPRNWGLPVRIQASLKIVRGYELLEVLNKRR